MKKTMCVLALFIFGMNAYAATQPTNSDEKTEIITPNVATGFYRTYKFTYDKHLNVLICPDNMIYDSSMMGDNKECTDNKNNKNNNKWLKMENAIPLNKKFVGFKSVTQGTGHYIEVYWK